MSTDPHSAPQQDHHGDQDGTLTPAQAAGVLEVSKRRVLQMLERGELVGDQDPETGRWSIPPAHIEDLRRRREQEQRKKPPKGTPQDQGTPAADRELVDTLREQVEDLRGRLDVADQRDREQRRIIAALTSRIPELPPATTEATVGPESTGPTDTPTEAPGEPQRQAQRPQAEGKRSLWRRIFGP